MKRRRVDLRIVLPAAIAAACFAVRAVPRPDAATTTAPRAVALPQMRALATRGKQVHYELDREQSTVRFLVTGTGGQLLAHCTRIDGSLTLGPAATQGTMQLHLDLASLQLHDAAASGLDVRQVLGVLGDLTVDYRGELFAVTSVDLPGLARDTWLGTIHFGPRVVRQPMVLWRGQLPGRSLRTQGHGTVDGESFGLPDRTWFGLWGDRFEVTLGLDLAWRRTRDH